MSAKQTEILFLCGSPRHHASEALLALLEQGVRETGARSRKFLLSQKHIAPCKGCGYCESTGTCIMVDKQPPDAPPIDDYLELLDAFERADALAVVAPLFFAGPPAQLKALYDRMQPFYARKYLLGQQPPAKKPAQIFILGGGGDAHGYEPLVTISRSALAVAGFSLEKTQNFIGFKHARDIADVPSEEDAAALNLSELAHLKKAAARQREFEQRALAAGGAFARFANHALTKNEHDEDAEQRGEVDVVDQVDSGFEALKKSARAAKASSAEEAVAKAKAELVAHEEQEAEAELAARDEFKAQEEPRIEAEAAKEAAADALQSAGAVDEAHKVDEGKDLQDTQARIND